MRKPIFLSLIALFLSGNVYSSPNLKTTILMTSGPNTFYSSPKDLNSVINRVKEFHKLLLENQKAERIRKEQENIAYRPKGCPLKSGSYQSLSAKMSLVTTELENNPKCTNAMKGTLDNISSSIDKLKKLEEEARKNEAIFNPDAPAASDEDAAAAEAELLKRNTILKGVQTMLGSFSTIAGNVECQKTMNATQITSNLADAIFGVSGMGLLAPGPAGYGTAIGGMAAGSLLKIISLLIKPTWNFDKEEDRNGFVKISCSLFDIKSDMEEVGLLQHRTTESSSEITSIDRILNKINNFIGELNASSEIYTRKQKLKEIPIILRALTTTKLGLEDPNIKLYKLFSEVRRILNGPALIATTSDERADIIVTLFEKHKEILNILKNSGDKINLGRVSRLRDLPATLKSFPKVVRGANSGDALWQIVLSDRTKERESFKEFTSSFMRDIAWLEANQKLKIFKAKGGLKAVVKDPRVQAQILIQKLVLIKDNFNRRKDFLSNLKVGRVFSDADDGELIKANIMKNFQTIQDSIYGKTGKKFMEFVSDEGMDYIKDFIDRYDNTRNFLDKRDKKQCPNFLKLRSSFITAQSFANLGYDFLQANKDSFYDSARSWLIGTKGWHQSRLKDHLTTSREVVDLINQNRGNIPFTVKNKYKRPAFNTLGALMFEVSQKYKHLEHVQKFINNNRCASRKATTILPNWVDTSER